MTGIKFGGIVLTGIGAWILINKGLNIVRDISSDAKTASMWRNYYKCWSKNRGLSNDIGNPIAPGYSVTERPLNRNAEIVKDPSGKDHSHDGEEQEEKKEQYEANVKAGVDIIKDVLVSALKARFGVSDEETTDSPSEDVDTKFFVRKTETASSENDGNDVSETDGEKITEYDENGKPVAGRYSFDVYEGGDDKK